MRDLSIQLSYNIDTMVMERLDLGLFLADNYDGVRLFLYDISRIEAIRLSQIFKPVEVINSTCYIPLRTGFIG